MEKIYMHDSEKNVKRGKKKQIVLGGALLSIVAVAALVITTFSGISFAIPEEGVVLGDTFTSAAIVTNDRIIGETGNFTVNRFATTANDTVFCLERDIPYEPNLEYKKDITINDAGLVYLMANLYPSVSFKADDGSDLSLGAQVWLTQSAIWIYAAQNNYPNNTTMTQELITSVLTEKKIYDTSMNTVAEVTDADVAAGKQTLYQKYGIDKLLADANTLKSIPANRLDVTRKTNNISLTSDGKYYQTDYISVVGTVSSEKIGKFNGYQVTLANAPEGTIVIDEDGNEIKDLSNFSVGTKFAVRVPVANLKESNKELQISVLGSFDTYIAHRYVYTGSQTVTAVKRINNNLSAPLNIQMNYTPTVPNTALDNTNTLFFIGIILLLSGLGVFYTSAKKN